MFYIITNYTIKQMALLWEPQPPLLYQKLLQKLDRQIINIIKLSDPLGCYCDVITITPVSYTHLDVYKRQILHPLLQH